MKKLGAIIVNFFLLTIPLALAWAAEPGEKVADLAIHKVKMEGISFINAFFAGWYNDSKMIFAIIVTLIMALVGGVIAVITDLILKVIGMDVSKIEHHE